jgi:phenylpropionate dioxygenase-like ring-hydroxylating dioxygenase large terminal subunit
MTNLIFHDPALRGPALRDPVLLNDWHPIAIAAEIPIGAVTASQLLDVPLALWRDSAGHIHAWEDRCPHRGTPFSMGSVQGDGLRCAYHGWTFGAEGRCSHIPAMPALGANQLKARARTFAVQQRHGLVWVCLGTASAQPAPIPEFDDEALRKVWCGPYDVATSGPRIVENFLDMAHFSFIHEGLLGAADRAAIADYTVAPFDDGEGGQGIIAAHCQAWQPQASSNSNGGAMVDYSYRVLRPLTAVLTKRAGPGASMTISLHAQALTEISTRVWIIMALDDVDSCDAVLRQFQDTIFLQDQPILESQRPQRLPLLPGVEVSVPCDKMSLAYRSYLKRQQLRYGVLVE